MTALPVPMPPQDAQPERAGPTMPLPPLPPGVADEVTQDDLLDLARMSTLRLLPLEARARLDGMLRLIRIGHEQEARRLARCVATDDHALGQLREVEENYREQERTASARGDVRRVRIIHQKLRELAHDIGVVELSRADHERQRQEHVQAAASIGRSQRPVVAGGTERRSGRGQP